MTVRAKSLLPRGTCAACGRLVEWAPEDGRALAHSTTVYSSAPDGETAIECPGSGRLVKEAPPRRFNGHCQLVPPRVWTRLSGAPDVEVYLMGDGRVLSRRSRISERGNVTGRVSPAELGPCHDCGTPYRDCLLSDPDAEYVTDANGNHDGLCCEDCWHTAHDAGVTT